MNIRPEGQENSAAVSFAALSIMKSLRAIASCRLSRWQGPWKASAPTKRPSVSLTGTAMATMFSMNPSEITDDEISDAVGEVVNLFAGNVKGCLPGSGKLTIPEVHQRVCPVKKHRVVLADVALAFEEHPIPERITVFHGSICSSAMAR